MNVQAENLSIDVLLSDRLKFLISQFLSGGLKLYLMNISHLSVWIPLLLSFAKLTVRLSLILQGLRHLVAIQFVSQLTVTVSCCNTWNEIYNLNNTPNKVVNDIGQHFQQLRSSFFIKTSKIGFKLAVLRYASILSLKFLSIILTFIMIWKPVYYQLC